MFRFFLYTCMPAAALLAAGCRPPVSACPSRPSENPWCSLAHGIARQIPADLHDVERNRALSDTAITALDLGAHKQAAAIAYDISGWRRGDLLARLGHRCHATGRGDAGDRFLKAAENVARDTGLDSWQRSRIQLAIERARTGRTATQRSEAARVTRLDAADQAALLPDLMQHTVATSNVLDTLNRLETVSRQTLAWQHTHHIARLQHRFQAGAVALEVGDEDLDQHGGAPPPDGPDRRGPVRGAAIGQIVARDGGEDDFAQAALVDRRGDFVRFAGVGRPHGQLVDVAEAAAAGAAVAQDHDGGAPARPAMPLVGAAGRFADGMEAMGAQASAGVEEPATAADADADPRGLGCACRRGAGRGCFRACIHLAEGLQ